MEIGKLVYILDLMRAQKTLAHELRILILVLQVYLTDVLLWVLLYITGLIISLKRNTGKVNVELASGPAFNVRGMAKPSRTRKFSTKQALPLGRILQILFTQIDPSSLTEATITFSLIKQD